MREDGPLRTMSTRAIELKPQSLTVKQFLLVFLRPRVLSVWSSSLPLLWCLWVVLDACRGLKVAFYLKWLWFVAVRSNTPQSSVTCNGEYRRHVKVQPYSRCQLAPRRSNFSKICQCSDVWTASHDFLSKILRKLRQHVFRSKEVTKPHGIHCSLSHWNVLLKFQQK